MKVEYGKTGSERKALVKAAEEITGKKAKYLKMPTCNYEVGIFTVTKDGSIECEDGGKLKALVASLTEKGFTPATMPELPEEETQEDVKAAGDALTIELPASTLDKDGYIRLLQITQAKETLIKKAIGADSIPVIRTDEKLIFPWFTAGDADSTKAYMVLVSKLCEFAKKAKRVQAKSKEIENEKYEFRCFLLRLGMIGDEYKTSRKILLKNLSGNAAWKGDVTGR